MMGWFVYCEFGGLEHIEISTRNFPEMTEENHKISS